MVILEQKGLVWSVGNVILVAVVFYFTWYALNRWVAPMKITSATV